MATSATNGHPQHRRTHRANHVVEFIVACRFEFFLRQLGWEHTGPKKTGRHQRQRILRRNLVACNLPAHKLIVRHIVVERLDDKIAVVIGMVPVGVLLKPKTVSITRNIKPMAPPTLTVMWRIQQLIHHTLKCRTRISISRSQEICNLLRSWRQADDVKVESTQQYTVLCRVVGLDPGSLKLRQDKVIDLIRHPLTVLHLWNGRHLQRRESPVLPVAFSNLHFAIRYLRIDESLSIRRTHIDPLSELGDQPGRQFSSLCRHVRFLRMRDQLKEPTGLRTARHYSRSFAATFE